jgi:hypothetical protein
MRTIITLGLAALAFFVTAAFGAEPNIVKTNPDGSIEVPIPKGAVHIVVTSGDKQLKEIFTYFPYPPVPQASRVLPLSRTGRYRVEVNPDGSVAAVTILKTMGKRVDYSILRTFVRWKARPGPLRAVDVSWDYSYTPAGMRGYH